MSILLLCIFSHWFRVNLKRTNRSMFGIKAFVDFSRSTWINGWRNRKKKKKLKKKKNWENGTVENIRTVLSLAALNISYSNRFIIILLFSFFLCSNCSLWKLFGSLTPTRTQENCICVCMCVCVYFVGQ